MEIVQCRVCHSKVPRGQMKSHLGSLSCVEMAIQMKLEPLNKELDEAKVREDTLKSTLATVNEQCNELQIQLRDESHQNRMLIEQNTWLRHSKEMQKKNCQCKIGKLKKEKRELSLQLANVLEGKTNSGGKKRKRSRGGDGGRVRVVSSGNELEV